MDIQAWMEQFLSAMCGCFGRRLVFAGLQGSRGRGEGTPSSDIDVVVILDYLTVADLDAYRALAARMPQNHLMCGFVAGREELLCWDGADLFQFYHDTKPYLGSLDFLLPRIGEAEIRRAVHLGACNIYHACCHNYLYERDAEILRGCCKSAFFVLQAKYYLESGAYVSRRSDLRPLLHGTDRAVLEALPAEMFDGEFSKASALLLEWASGLIRQKPSEIGSSF